MKEQVRGLIFVHIPKAAGTTFFEIVKRQFPADALVQFDGEAIPERIEDLRNLRPEARAKVRCLFGHMPFGLHTHLDYPTDYITILRDPVDRLISHYSYVKRSPDNKLYAAVTTQNLSLEEYVQSGLAAELTNGQTRLLCGDTAVDSIYGHASVTEQAYQAAKRNLEERFLAVGLSERFDESLILFSKRLGWNRIFYRRVNVTRDPISRDSLPKSTIKIIQQYNAYDMAIYEQAKKLFEAAMTRSHVSGVDVMKLNWMNRAYQVYVSAKERRRTLRLSPA